MRAIFNRQRTLIVASQKQQPLFRRKHALASTLLGLLFLPIFAYAQTQLGADIDGEANNDRSGFSVSLSATGMRLAVGARLNDGTGGNAGHARVYEWSGSAWSQLGSDIDGEAADDRSGRAVSLSANGMRLAVGARFNDGNGGNAGHTRIYEWTGATWSQLGSDIDGEAGGDRAGYAVSLSEDGSRVAIGARLNDGTAPNAGHVRVLEWNGASWMQLGTDIDGEAQGDNSGYSVSLSADGSRLAVGARQNDGTGGNAGHTRVFDWNGTNWVQVGTDIDGEAANDRSGYFVSLAGDGARLAVGARLNDGTGSNAGHTRVFQWNGAAWTQLGNDIDGEAAADEAGSSVSLSFDGSRLAVGAPRNDGNGGNAGHTRLYAWNANAMSWEQIGPDLDGESNGDRAGTTVSISADGNRVAVGAPRNDGGGNNAGQARVFELPPPPTFTLAFSPTRISLNGSTNVATATFTIDNSASAAAASDLAFSTTLPAGLEVASPSNASTTCTGGTLTAVSGTGSITTSGASVAPAALCTMSVDVIATTSGTFITTSEALSSNLGNSGTATDTLEGDAPPVITLLGANPVSVFRTEAYNELGATVSDDFDAPAPGVVISGSVDTNTEGSYTLFYDATDSSGNPALQVSRVIDVIALPEIVTSALLPSGESGGITVGTSDAGCVFGPTTFIEAETLSPPPPLGLELPFGVAQFTVTGCTPGATLLVSIDYGSALPPGTSVWKSDPWRRLFNATVNGSVITYTVTDGGPRDADGLENGTIVDPVGAAVNVPIQVPVAPLWLLAMLGTLLGTLGAMRLQR